MPGDFVLDSLKTVILHESVIKQHLLACMRGHYRDNVTVVTKSGRAINSAGVTSSSCCRKVDMDKPTLRLCADEFTCILNVSSKFPFAAVDRSGR